MERDPENESEYYQLRSGRSRFHAHVWHQYPGVIDKVYIGGRRKCVCFSVYLEEEDGIFESPNLDAVGYDEHCNIEGDSRALLARAKAGDLCDLLRGAGTKHMMLVAFAFVRHQYGALADKVTLKDKSEILCRRPVHMPLSVYYALHYGQTWYQKQFHARIVDGRRQSQLTRAMEYWRSYKSAQPKPAAEVLFAGVTSERRRDQLVRSYADHRTLGSFLRSLKDADCFVFKDWAQPLIDEGVPFLHGVEWAIDIAALELPSDVRIEHLGARKPRDMFVHTGGMPLHDRY